MSQERTRLRERAIVLPERAADLIRFAVENGANGFMFSVSETTLSILRTLRGKGEIEGLRLYGIVPYAYEYVKLATQVGGIPGLAKRVGTQIVTSGNLKAMATGTIAFLNMDLMRIMKAYLTYETSRIRVSAGRKATIECMPLHEVITDLALALNLDWLFKFYIEYMKKLGIAPGFNTCNFARLIDKFRQWKLDLSETTIVAPFNKAGFQMNPSRPDCEKALASVNHPVLLAISILAAGYLMPSEAIDYISKLPNVKGAAIGISNEKHAYETFKILTNKLSSANSP